MFTINKCSLGWRVDMNNAKGAAVEKAYFQSMDDALAYLKERMEWVIK